MKDKNAQKRYEYNLKIMAKERKIDDLSSFKQSFQDSNDRFFRNIGESRWRSEADFQQIQSLDVRQEYEWTQEIYSRLDQGLSRQQRTLEQVTRKERKALEEEIEHLSKEKSQLPWD